MLAGAAGMAGAGAQWSAGSYATTTTTTTVAILVVVVVVVVVVVLIGWSGRPANVSRSSWYGWSRSPMVCRFICYYYYYYCCNSGCCCCCSCSCCCTDRMARKTSKC